VTAQSIFEHPKALKFPRCYGIYSIMTKLNPNKVVFKASIKVILTHNSFEWKETIVPMHRNSK